MLRYTTQPYAERCITPLHRRFANSPPALGEVVNISPAQSQNAYGSFLMALLYRTIGHLLKLQDEDSLTTRLNVFKIGEDRLGFDAKSAPNVRTVQISSF